MTIRPIVLTLALLACSAAARADIAPDPLGGGITPRPRGETTDVAMTAEEVELRLSRERLDVKVTFHLENLGKETSLEVGFPTSYKDELEKFAVEIDGKPAVPALKEQTDEHPLGGGRVIYTYWHVWEMSFAPAAKKTVVVSYSVKPNDQGFEVRGTWSSAWDEALGGEEVEASLNQKRTGYILETGAPWKGSIGKAVVHLALEDGLTSDFLRQMTPPPTTRTATSVDWTFTDLEPTENIQIVYCPGMSIDGELEIMRKVCAQELDIEEALHFREHIADLLRMKGDPAASRAAWSDVLEFVIRQQTAEMSPEYLAGEAIREVVDNLFVTPEALADATAAANARKAADFLERWIAFLRSSDDWAADDCLLIARAALLKILKALGRDTRELVRMLEVSDRGCTMDIDPVDADKVSLETERVSIVVGATTTTYDALYTLRGRLDGAVPATLWWALERPEAELVAAADGKFDNLAVSIGGKPVRVGCVERELKDDGKRAFVGWILPVKAGETLEVAVRFTVRNRAPVTGFVWMPRDDGPEDNEPRFHRQVAAWAVGGAGWTGPRQVVISLELPRDVKAAQIRHVFPETGKVDGSTVRWTLDAVETSGIGDDVDAWVQWKGFTLEEEIVWLQKRLESKPAWADLLRLQLALALHAAGRFEEEIGIWEGFIATKATPLAVGSVGSMRLEPGMYESRPFECSILEARRKLGDEKAIRAAAGRAVTALEKAIKECHGPQDEWIALWKELAESQRVLGNEKEAAEAAKKAKELEEKYR